MRAVKAGGDRQVLHERIRVHSLAAKDKIVGGADHNDLIERIRDDEAFASVKDELDDMMQPDRFTGLASRQTQRFLAEHIDPALEPYLAGLGGDVDINI